MLLLQLCSSPDEDIPTPTPLAVSPSGAVAQTFGLDTVAALAGIIAERTVVHVRRTPTSGKTVLALLLQNHYTLEYGPIFDSTSFYSDQNETVFIIDEAQTSYSDWALWSSILKT
jgi:hypothetical protein